MTKSMHKHIFKHIDKSWAQSPINKFDLYIIFNAFLSSLWKKKLLKILKFLLTSSKKKFYLTADRDQNSKLRSRIHNF